MKGNGRTFQRGNRWWIAFYAPDTKTGKRVEMRESAGDTEQEAQKQLEARRRELANDEDGIAAFTDPEMEKVRVAKILDDYIAAQRIKGARSLPQVKSRVKRLKGFFRMRALALRTDRIRQYIEMRQKDDAKEATINKEVGVLSAAFNLAKKEGRILKVPAFPDKLPENNARQGFFELSDYLAIRSHINDVDVQDYLDFFCATAMRNDEIKSLTWDAYDRETETIRLHASHARRDTGACSRSRAPSRTSSPGVSPLVASDANSSSIVAARGWVNSGRRGRRLARRPASLRVGKAGHPMT